MTVEYHTFERNGVRFRVERDECGAIAMDPAAHDGEFTVTAHVLARLTVSSADQLHVRAQHFTHAEYKDSKLLVTSSEGVHEYDCDPSKVSRVSFFIISRTCTPR